MVDVVALVVLAFVGVRLFGGSKLMLRPAVRQHVAEIVRGLRVRHFVLAVPVLVAVIVAAFTLTMVPGLSWGWWSAIGGVGSPVFGSTEASAGTPLEWIVPLVFLLLLIPALPLFAEAEERIFRRGAEHWSTARRITRAVEFGLVHCVVGVPIGVGLALSIGGLYFTWAYLRGGLMESTRAHLAYNATVLGLVGVGFVFGV